jgi:hypothetical protein
MVLRLRFSARPDEVAYSKGSQDQDQEFHFDLLLVFASFDQM